MEQLVILKDVLHQGKASMKSFVAEWDMHHLRKKKEHVFLRNDWRHKFKLKCVILRFSVQGKFMLQKKKWLILRQFNMLFCVILYTRSFALFLLFYIQLLKIKVIFFLVIASFTPHSHHQSTQRVMPLFFLFFTYAHVTMTGQIKFLLFPFSSWNNLSERNQNNSRQSTLFLFSA